MSGPLKATPGPWKALPHVKREGHTVYTSNGIVIATTGTHSAGSDELANARLIAAAPELYEAALAVFNHLNERIDDACQNNPESVPVFAGIAALSDALAKARGEAA